MSTKKYLDDNGLTYFWGKVKNSIPPYKDYSTSVNFNTLTTGIYKVNANNLTLDYSTDVRFDGVQDMNIDVTINLTKGDIITVQRAGNVTGSLYVGDFFEITGSKNKTYKIISSYEHPDTSFMEWTTYTWKINDPVITKTSELTNNSGFVTDASYVHTDNNYTTTEKTKLAGIEASADVNTIESISLNGTALTPDVNKNVNLVISGSNDEIAISTTQPSGDETLWINPNDTLNASSVISNSYGTSQSIGYSQEYANEHFGETILYSNSTGTTGDVTLNSNLSNYSYIEIYGYHSIFNDSVYTKVDLSLNKSINVSTITTNGQQHRLITQTYTKGTNKLTRVYAFRTTIFDRTIAEESSVDGEIYITKVLGYK